MNLDSLTLGEVKQLTNLVGGKRKKEICDGGVRIVVLQRGWVVVGRYSQHGSDCKITNGFVIRNWGTDKGLGQLAMEGPLTNTKLDPCPDITFHELTKVMDIQCVEAKWSGKCVR